jgi:hypothetical protein
VRRVATPFGQTVELCLLVGVAVVGLVSELVAGDGRWWADLLVGLAVGITGALVVGHRTRDPVGWLLVAASLLWFVGTVVGGELVLAHRGCLLIVLFAPLWVVPLPQRMSRWTLIASAVVAAAACSVSVGPWATSQTALVVVAAASCALASHPSPPGGRPTPPALLPVSDRTVRLVDVATRAQLGDGIRVPLAEIGASLRPDGRVLAVHSTFGVALWDLDPTSWEDAACRVAGRNLTREEWDRYVGELAPYRATCPASS